MKKAIIVLLLLLISFPLFGETYYQNKNRFTITVPTAIGGTVEVPPGKFVGGTYYAALVGPKKLSTYSGPDPVGTDIIYVYVPVSPADAILPDQTTANGKFLKSVLGTATWDNALTGSLTAGRVPYATGASTVADKAGFAFDSDTDVLSVPSIKLSSLTSGRIPVIGANGLVSDDAGLTFDKATKTLTSEKVIATSFAIVGPDPYLWSVQANGNKVGRISMDGTVTEYAIPTAGSQPLAIAAGPDRHMWFVESTGNKIGKISAGGVITEYPLPSPGSNPSDIALGPDGAMWFTEYDGGRIGRITTDGVITEFAGAANANFLTLGPDGAMWFTELLTGKVGRITTAGVITKFDTPGANTYPEAIVTGPDGNLWFCRFGANSIGRMTPAGVFTDFPVGAGTAPAYGLVVGPDGNLWFTEFSGGKIGRITIAGVITEFAIPTAGTQPYDIAAGPDGNLWFAMYNKNKIGRITTAGVITEFAGCGSASCHVYGMGTGPADAILGYAMRAAGLQVYADNTEALAGGLVAGEPYRTSTGVLMVAY